MNESQTAFHPMPRLGDAAVPFRVRTTMGERSLDGYRGRWLLLFSHPADFTPVCTSELIALAQVYERFQAMNCDLLGLSVDSLFAHVAWLHSIRERFGVDIPFPIAEDLSMALAGAYGMIHPADGTTATVRAAFLIDPQGIIRLLSYYPMTTGRDPLETLRALAALQETDRSGLSTPAGWQPGEAGVRAAPLTLAEATARQQAGAPAWYYQPEQPAP